MSDALIRKLRILQMLPREGEGGITVNEIQTWLERDFGISVIKRNIERDLRALQDTEKGGFPLSCDEESKPYQWSWYGNEAIGIPKMGRHTALTFHLVKELLWPLLTAESLNYLRPNFEAAEKILKKKSEQKTRRWLDKIRVVPRSLRLIPAPIRKGVLDRVSEALYDEKQIEITYKAASSKTGRAKKYTLNPYALLHRDSIVELVGGMDGDQKTRR
ncbi:MAG: hypothetical protein KZQ58_11605 [gamma proteobacterium symbiont of Bathyaustriella thionipta]|nr:hypothetical protein [gamma proteobacterium symbiont of Bathyaustriella thionipta]